MLGFLGQDYESDYKFPIRDERISHLLPAFYQDMIVRVYSKKPELVWSLVQNCLCLITTNKEYYHDLYMY